MKRLILLYMSMLINAIFCMEDAVQYKALVNIEGMRVLAQNVAPKDYKKTLKTYNLTPQAMAACVRHFCGLSTTEEKEMQFFQNKKDVNYKDYIATGVLMLQVLKDESDGKGLPYLDWAACHMICTISKQADEQEKELKPKKSCYDKFGQWAAVVGLTGILFVVSAGAGILSRTACH